MNERSDINPIWEIQFQEKYFTATGSTHETSVKVAKTEKEG
jgi:hypothetical protein